MSIPRSVLRENRRRRHAPLRQQLSREPRPYPVLTIKRKPASIFGYEFEDFEVQGYDPHGAIKAPVAV